MDHRDVDAAVAEAPRVLGPRAAEDWTVRAGPLEWSCLETAAHVAHDLPAYAGKVAARPADAYLPFDLTVRPDAPPADVLQVVTACGGLLGGVPATAGPDLRAWHWGPCDAEGFAATGVAETPPHAHDIARGLSVDWLPPAPVSRAVLDRLFPGCPARRPHRVLLWCTGRGDLDGLPRRTSWTREAARADRPARPAATARRRAHRRRRAAATAGRRASERMPPVRARAG